MKENGFKPIRIPAAPDPEEPAYNPIFDTADKQKQFLSLIERKLKLTQDLIITETEYDRDRDRKMTEDATAILLAEPPIAFNFYIQEVFRDLVKLRDQFVELEGRRKKGEKMLQAYIRRREQEGEDELARQRREKEEAVGVNRKAENKRLGQGFKWAWGQLRGELASLVPGHDEEKTRRVYAMMERVLGISLEDEEEEDVVQVEAKLV